MSRATTCPQIIHDVQNYKIVQERSFSIPIGEIFSPHDGTLKFYLKSAALPWLHLDHNNGILYGIAPKVPYNKYFKFTLTASNEMGFVTKSFILIVIDTEVVETMPQTLELILSLRKHDYGYIHLQPYTPTLLEYLYYFYQQPEFLQSFNKSVHEAAHEKGLVISDKVSFHEFDSVLKAINPDIEKALLQLMEEDKLLTEETLNNQELQNLFREGSQSPGAITIPIWNYCGNPNLFNWPEWQVFMNVMHAAAHAVRHLREENLQQQNMYRPELKPSKL